MGRDHFQLVSEWHLSVPPDAVWRVLTEPQHWPDWWPEVRSVRLVEPGGANDEGAVRRTEWASRLPYGFTLHLRTLVAEQPRLLVVAATGDLEGLGRWELIPIPVGVRVRYVWQVRLSRLWMRALAPLLRPVFAWNHHAVMRSGARGMAQHLQAELIDYHREA